MSFFKSWRSHYTAGFLLGLALRPAVEGVRRAAITRLDRWAYEREWAQNLKANHPNPELSAHSLREAMAWGAGARQATGLDQPYPSPPYKEGVTWESVSD